MAAATLRGLLAALLAVPAEAQLKVIGAGLPRTGTESLGSALEILGFGKDTHNFCNFPLPCLGAACTWMAEGNVTPLLEHVRDSKYPFVVDEPLCLAYRELAESFPEAKVVLTVRDDASAWYRSYAEMQQYVFEDRSLPRTFTVNDFLAMGDLVSYCDQLPHAKFDCDIYSDDPPPDMVGRCKRGYEEYNAKVQREIPKERLLVFNAKQGWEPLCKFLGVPVPNVPFPWNNAYMDSLRQKHRLRARALLATWAGLAVVVLLLLYCCRPWRAVFRKKEAAE